MTRFTYTGAREFLGLSESEWADAVLHWLRTHGASMLPTPKVNAATKVGIEVRDWWVRSGAPSPVVAATRGEQCHVSFWVGMLMAAAELEGIPMLTTITLPGHHALGVEWTGGGEPIKRKA